MNDPRSWEENNAAIKAAKQEILAEIAKANGKLEIGATVKAVKSIQRGVISIEAQSQTGTVTINEVDTKKSVVLYGGTIYGYDYNGSSYTGTEEADIMMLMLLGTP